MVPKISQIRPTADNLKPPTTYVTADHLGSGNIFLNSAGTKLINESFSAYGYRRKGDWSVPLSTTSSDYTTIASTTRRGYTDAFHEMLDNLDLIQMKGRVYDPVIGRFMSPDPIVTQVGNSQSINPYSYVQNRPLTLTDPTGMVQSRAQPIDPVRLFGRLGRAQLVGLFPGELSGVAPMASGNQGGGWFALQGNSAAVDSGSWSGGSVGYTTDPLLAQQNQLPANQNGTADATLAGPGYSNSQVQLVQTVGETIDRSIQATASAASNYLQSLAAPEIAWNEGLTDLVENHPSLAEVEGGIGVCVALCLPVGAAAAPIAGPALGAAWQTAQQTVRAGLVAAPLSSAPTMVTDIAVTQGATVPIALSAGPSMIAEAAGAAEAEELSSMTTIAEPLIQRVLATGATIARYIFQSGQYLGE